MDKNLVDIDKLFRILDFFTKKNKLENLKVQKDAPSP
jgi:hypothetical protein